MSAKHLPDGPPTVQVVAKIRLCNQNYILTLEGDPPAEELYQLSAGRVKPVDEDTKQTILNCLNREE